MSASSRLYIRSFVLQLSTLVLTSSQTCPFLLPVYWKFGGHHHPKDFQPRNLPDQHLNMYTWYVAWDHGSLRPLLLACKLTISRKDATLKELTTLLKEGHKGVRYSLHALQFDCDSCTSSYAVLLAQPVRCGAARTQPPQARRKGARFHYSAVYRDKYVPLFLLATPHTVISALVAMLVIHCVAKSQRL